MTISLARRTAGAVDEHEIAAESDAPRTRRMPIGAGDLIAAAAPLTLLAAVGLLAYGSGRLRWADSRSYGIMASWNRPGWQGFEYSLVHTVNIAPFVVACLCLAGFAVMRRSRGMTWAVITVLLGPSITTEALQSVLPTHTATLVDASFGVVTRFPSGHASAAMSIVAATTMLASAGRRWLIALFGSLYAVVVGIFLVMLGNHYASDVVAGFLVVAIWALMGLGLLAKPEASIRMTAGWPLPALLTALSQAGVVTVSAVLARHVMLPYAGSTRYFVGAVFTIALTAFATVCVTADRTAAVLEEP